MENCSFHSQLVSVMEVLARAAVEEINRRVDDGCAVLRRDVDLLKRKCEVMETELRRNRMRARRKGEDGRRHVTVWSFYSCVFVCVPSVFSPPAAERFSPLVKIVMNKDRQRDTETQSQPQQVGLTRHFIYHCSFFDESPYKWCDLRPYMYRSIKCKDT